MHLDSQRKVDEAQAEDPDAAPPGAKGSKESGAVSNKRGHRKFEKHGREGHIPMKEVGMHDLAVSDGCVVYVVRLDYAHWPNCCYSTMHG